MFDPAKRNLSLSLRILKMFSETKLISDARKIELYFPFLFMGVKVLHLDPDLRLIRMKLPLTSLSRNPGGVLFGGFQACLADPIAGLSCARRFKTHACWTRHLSLDFQRGADSDLELRFEFSKEQEDAIAKELLERDRATPTFTYGFYSVRTGDLCTLVTNTVAIRPFGWKKAVAPPIQSEKFGENL